MGLFSRRKPQSQALPQQQSRPSTPTPSTSHGSVAPDPQSPSASSVISRISRRPWGRNKPKPKPGPAVTEESPFLTVPSVPPPRNTSSRDLRTVGHAASSTSHLLHARPRAASTLGLPDDAARERSLKVSSGEWRKQGGILGKLDFEGVPAPTASNPQLVDGASTEVGGDWLHLDREEGVVQREDEGEGALALTAQVSGLSKRLQSQTPFSQETQILHGDDDLELLDSPEADKKEKSKDKAFWKGKRKVRNDSSAPSEFSVDRPESPTPRRTSAHAPEELRQPSPPPGAEEAARPPPPLRRISSAIFANPFNRPMSRASVAYVDQETPVADEGSFRLKGFRHVSGVSDSDIGLAAYMGHIPRHSIATGDNVASPSAVPAVLHSSASSPPSSFPFAGPRPAQTRPSPSRPPSIAGSLLSLDEMTSSKMSVGAFRRGIRRPSEGRLAMSVDGHGTYRDDDDDLPLGDLMRPRKGSALNSALSLTDLIDEPTAGDAEATEPSEYPSRHNSPQPSLAFAVRKHQRTMSGGSGFVLKASTTTRPSSAVPDQTEDNAKSEEDVFVSPSGTRLASYSGNPDPVGPPMVASPTDFNPSDNLLSPISMNSSRTSTPASDACEHRHRDGTSRTPPPVEPIHLPQPENERPDSPSSLLLPLPPDQMPDSPMPVTTINQASGTMLNLPQSPSVIAAALREKVRSNSLVTDPLRVLSGMWSSPADNDDDSVDAKFGADAKFAVDSLNAFGGNETPQRPRPMKSQNIDVTPSTTASNRLSLADRLAQAAATPGNMGGPDRPHLDRLGFPDRDSDEALPINTVLWAESQGSHSATASPITSTLPLDDRAPLSQATKRLVKDPRKKEFSWSSSEGDSDEEASTRPRGPRQPGKKVDRLRVLSNVSASSNAPSSTTVSDRAASTRQRRQFVRGPVDDSSSEDEPLTTLKSRASRSSLALSTRDASPNPPQPAISKSLAVLSAPGSSSSQNTQNAQDKTSSLATASRNQQRPQQGRTTQAPVPIRRVPIRSPAKLPASLPAVNSKMPDMRGNSASPASNSSQSGLSGVTADTLPPMPITPRDSGAGYDRRAGFEGDRSAVHTSPAARQQYLHPDAQAQWSRPQSSMSAASMPTWQTPYDPSLTTIPGPIPGYDNPAMLHMMKQHFQASYMAAAARQCEEEWERASAASTSHAHASQPSYGFMPSFPTTPFPYPFPMPGMSPTQIPQWPMQYPFPMQYSQPPQAGFGGYAYSPGPQSVFGGNFGPPSALPSQRTSTLPGNQPSSAPRQRHSSFDPSIELTPTKLRVSHYPAEAPSSSGERKTGSNRQMESSPPPSSWRKSGEWEDLSTPRKRGPTAQIIN